VPLLDERFNVVQVAIECPAAARGEPVRRFGTTRLECLGTPHIPGLFQLAGVRAQVAVTYAEQCLELAESQLLAHRQGTHHAQPHTLVNQAIEARVIHEL
jgi:acetoin utilization deacetylase AcuC-like enzyme